MQKIVRRYPDTPGLAHFAKVISKRGDALTVEYYSMGGSPVSGVGYGARIMNEDTYEKMVKAPAEPKGKATPDPRVKELEKRRDLPKGKKLTGIEQQLIDLDVDEVTLDAEDEIEVGINKRATPPVGKAKGQETKTIAKVNESIGDETLFTWATIREKMIEIGQDKDMINDLLTRLTGNEMSSDIGESTFARLYSLKEEPVVYDPEGAQDDFAATQEPSEKKNDFTVGMTLQEVEENLVNLSDRYAKKIEDLPRGWSIKILRMQDGKVSKILDSKLLKISKRDSEYYAVVKVVGQERSFPIGGPGEMIKLKQTKNGNFVYVDNKQSQEKNKLKVKFRG